MRRLLFPILALVLMAASLAPPALADNDDPLFINMTTADAHRAKMAIVFARKQQELKHPITIFLNDKGVLVGAKSKAAEFKEHQDGLAAIMKAGGVVIACPMCMDHYGVAKDDLMDGIQPGNPKLTGDRLFEDDTKTLTW